MTLREQRSLFTRLKAQLYLWIFERGWQAAADEGTVHSPRRIRIDGGTVTGADGMHKLGSFHGRGLAEDILLYDDLDSDGEDDDYIASGVDWRWYLIARRWESMHDLCISGARWADANHISFGEGLSGKLREPIESFFPDAVVLRARATGRPS